MVDEPERICAQLYEHAVSTLDLTGRDILEISCGHGGGASFLKRYKHARTVTGIDLNDRGIRFCSTHYAVPGLSFAWGNAECLQYEDASFDVVVNIEASHRFTDMDKFLSEVRRVLRPGGYLAIADFRLSSRVDGLKTQLARSGLDIVNEDTISENVVQAMKLQSEARNELIRARVPKIFQSLFKSFAGVERTPIYTSFVSGDRVYMSFVLRKSEA